MANLIEIQTQIEKLQKQASDIKQREFESTVQDIKAKMAAFGITVADLKKKSPGKARRAGTGTKKTVKPKLAGSKSKGQKVAAKYKGPAGETWSGRGLAPKWLAALIASGRTKDEFAI